MGTTRGRLTALIAEEAEGEGRIAAETAGLMWEAVRSVSDLLESFRRKVPEFALLSFGFDSVDPALAARIGEALARTGGSLLASAPGASLEVAVAARRLGCGALLSEPLDRTELGEELRRRVDRPEGPRLPPRPAAGDEPGLVGSGRAMIEIVKSIAQVGDSTATVLITGESGTGKELVARALHWSSPRRDGPFVALNCAAVPETLLESEFFGHERGAFTGAVARKEGRFERASGGTLFLDEIGDMSLVLQAKLLRTLEEREVERVGGETTIPIDVRILAATNRALEERVSEGSFREDLYYRLAVARIDVAPLRERMDDLEELVLHFVGLFADRYGRRIEGVGKDAMKTLSGHAWPGNVRELRNVLDRAVLMSRGGWIRSEDLRLGRDSPTLSPGGNGLTGEGYPLTYSLERVEADHISRVLAFTGGAMKEAAEILGIHRNTLTRKAGLYGLRSETGT